MANLEVVDQVIDCRSAKQADGELHASNAAQSPKFHWRWWLPPVMVVVISLVYLPLLIKVFTAGKLGCVWADEWFYFGNAKAWATTGVLADAFVLDGVVSRIGQFGSHGFFYTLWDGIWLKICHHFYCTKVISNLLSLGLACGAVFAFACMKQSDKWLLLLLLSLFFFIPMHLCTYMAESLHISIAIVWGVLLTRLGAQIGEAAVGQMQTGKKQPATHPLVAYGAFLCLAALMKPYWLFMTPGIFPFLSGQREKKALMVLSILAGLLAIALMQCFFAPYQQTFLQHAISLCREGHWWFTALCTMRHLGANLQMYFVSQGQGSPHYVLFKYLYVGLTGYLLWSGRNLELRLTRAVALKGSVAFLILMVLYEAFNWADIRFLAPFFVLYLFALINDRHMRALKITAVALCISSFLATPDIYAGLHERLTCCSSQRSDAGKLKASLCGPATVECSKNLLRSGIVADLPLMDQAGNRLCYSFRVTPAVLVLTNERAPVQYALTEPSLVIPGRLPLAQVKSCNLWPGSLPDSLW